MTVSGKKILVSEDSPKFSRRLVVPTPNGVWVMDLTELEYKTLKADAREGNVEPRKALEFLRGMNVPKYVTTALLNGADSFIPLKWLTYDS